MRSVSLDSTFCLLKILFKTMSSKFQIIYFNLLCAVCLMLLSQTHEGFAKLCFSRCSSDPFIACGYDHVGGDEKH